MIKIDFIIFDVLILGQVDGIEPYTCRLVLPVLPVLSSLSIDLGIYTYTILILDNFYAIGCFNCYN